MNIINQNNTVVATSTKEFTTPLYGGDILEIKIPSQWYSGYMLSGSTTTYILLPLDIPGTLNSAVGKYVIWINGAAANRVPNKITFAALGDEGAKAYLERPWTTTPTTSAKYIITSEEILSSDFEYKDLISKGETLYHQIQLDSDDLSMIVSGRTRREDGYPIIVQNSNIKIGDVIKSGTRMGRITGLGNNRTGWIKGFGSYYDVEISSDFTPALGGNTYYEIYSGGSYSVNNYIFYTRRKPRVNHYAVTFFAPEWNFTAIYNQEQNVGITRHRWQCYVQDDIGEYHKIDDTGYIYSSKLEYFYSGLMHYKRYKIRLEVEDESGYVTTAERNVSPFTVTTIPEMETIINSNNIELNLQSLTKPEGHYKTIIYKETVGKFNPKHLVDVSSNTISVKDYNVSCGYHYRYHVYLKGTSTKYYYTTTQYITPKTTRSWNIMELKETTVGGKYNVGQTWDITLDVRSGEQVSNYDKTIYKNLSKYPKSSYGNNNYVTGSLTFKLGEADCSGKYINDNAQKLKEWREFVNSGSLKLLKDSVGQIFVVDIDSLSNNINDGYDGSINDITFSYVEIGNADEISVIEVSN